MIMRVLALITVLAVGAVALKAVGIFPDGAPAAVIAGAEPARTGTDDTALPVVTVTTVASADFIETVLITGSVVARDEILVHPEVEGLRIEEIAAEEGDSVKKGQLLARLSNESLDAQIEQNRANVIRAASAIAVAESGIVQAEAAVKEASNAFDRAKPLKQSGYMSGAAYDQRESAAATSQSKLVAARDQLMSAKADKAAFEAQGRELAWRRTRTEVRAPVDGLVTRRTARTGAVASALNEPLFRLVARGEVELDAEVAERDLPKVKEGQAAVVIITGGTVVNGTVRLISSEVDRASRIGKVRIFLGVNPALKIGAFGRGTISTAKSRGLSVPTSAVIISQDGGIERAKVQLVIAGRVVEREVKIGLKTEAAIEIQDGLAAGDTIVARSGSFLRDGDAVHPVEAAAKPAAEGSGARPVVEAK